MSSLNTSTKRALKARKAWSACLLLLALSACGGGGDDAAPEMNDDGGGERHMETDGGTDDAGPGDDKPEPNEPMKDGGMKDSGPIDEPDDAEVMDPADTGTPDSGVIDAGPEEPPPPPCPAPDKPACIDGPVTPTTIGVSMLPSLPEDFEPLAAVMVEFEEDAPSDATATLQFHVEEDPDGTGTVIVVRFAPDTDESHPVDASVDGDTVTVQVYEDGTYVVVQVEPEIPDGCTERTFNGAINATSNVDVAQLQGVTRLTGNLTIGGNVTDLGPLSCLTWVTGNISVQNAASLTRAEFPAVAWVSGSITVSNDVALTEVSFPSLRSLGGASGYPLNIGTLSELTSIRFPKLTEVRANLYLNQLSATADDPLVLDFGSLVTVGGELNLVNLDTLEDLSGFAALARVEGAIIVQTNADLVQAHLPALRNLVGRLYVYNDAKLASVALPALREIGTVSNYSVYFNALPELVAIDLSSLRETPGYFELQTVGATADGELELNLASLTTVRGSFTANRTDNLVDLTGAPSLELIDGSLDLTNNAALERVELDGLEQIVGRAYIVSNPKLERVSASAMTDIGQVSSYSVYLYNLPEITSVDFGAVTEAPGYVELNTLGATAGGTLTADFGALRIIRGNLELQATDNLVDLAGFGALELIDGTLHAQSNSSLEHIDLPAIEEIVGRLYVYNNAKLISLELPALSEIGTVSSYSVYVATLPELTSIDLGALTQTPGYFYLGTIGATADGSLTVDCGSLTTVRGELQITTVSNLETLAGFAALELIDGTLHLQANEHLVSASLPALEEVVGRVYIYNNAALSSIDMSVLTSVGTVSSYSLYLVTLPELTSVDYGALQEAPGYLELNTVGGSADGPLSLDFGMLATVRGNLEIQNADNLSNVGGFAALTTIEGTLYVYANNALVNLNGFNALTTLGGNLTVTSNPALPTCEASLLRNDLQTTGFDGTATISGNLADSCS